MQRQTVQYFHYHRVRYKKLSSAPIFYSRNGALWGDLEYWGQPLQILKVFPNKMCDIHGGCDSKYPISYYMLLNVTVKAIHFD